MWDQLGQIAATYGIWAAMFIGLLVYLLQDSRQREAKYQQVVEKLTVHLDVVNDIKEDVLEIKSEIRSK